MGYDSRGGGLSRTGEVVGLVCTVDTGLVSLLVFFSHSFVTRQGILTLFAWE